MLVDTKTGFTLPPPHTKSINAQKAKMVIFLEHTQPDLIVPPALILFFWTSICY